MGLIEDLGRGPVGLDSAVFIYFLEEHPRYLKTVLPVFEAAAAGRIALITSTITLLEVMVVPLRAGDLQLADRYEALLTRSRNLDLVDLDRKVIRIAAELRVAFGVKTPDALQLAAALSRRCTAFLTNDRALPPIPGMRVLQLHDYLR